MPRGCVITSLSYAEWPMVSLHHWNFWHSEVFHIMRGASALLVSTDWALPEPQGVERATVQGFTLFLCLYPNTIITLAVL